MKTVLACVFLIAAAANAFDLKQLKAVQVPDSDLEDAVNQTVEAIRAMIPDPWTVEYLAFTAPELLAGLISGTVEYTKIKTEGLAGFQLTQLTIDEEADTAAFTLVVPLIVNHADHNGTGTLFGTIPIDGTGTVDFKLTRLVVSGRGHLDRSNGGIRVDGVEAGITIGSNEFTITNMMGSDAVSGLVNAFFSNVLPNFINNNPDVINDVVGPLVQAVINLILDLLVNN